MSAAAPDKWASGRLYEPYVGRWSRRVAESFLPWTDSPRRASWLDIGCGTGALVDCILAYAAPRSVKGIDPSEGFLATAVESIRDPRVTFELADAQQIPAADAAYEAVVSGLVLNFIPRPQTAMTGA